MTNSYIVTQFDPVTNQRRTITTNLGLEDAKQQAFSWHTKRFVTTIHGPKAKWHVVPSRNRSGWRLERI